MKYEKSSNSIIMTPSKDDEGSYEIKIQLSDEDGKKSSTQVFNIVIISSIAEILSEPGDETNSK